MRKVKIFKSVVSELEALESEVNDWIETHGVDVVSITGNISPQTHLPTSSDTFSVSEVMIIVSYEATHAKG